MKSNNIGQRLIEKAISLRARQDIFDGFNDFSEALAVILSCIKTSEPGAVTDKFVQEDFQLPDGEGECSLENVVNTNYPVLVFEHGEYICTINIETYYDKTGGYKSPFNVTDSFSLGDVEGNNYVWLFNLPQSAEISIVYVPYTGSIQSDIPCLSC